MIPKWMEENKGLQFAHCRRQILWYASTNIVIAQISNANK